MFDALEQKWKQTVQVSESRKSALKTLLGTHKLYFRKYVNEALKKAHLLLVTCGDRMLSDCSSRLRFLNSFVNWIFFFFSVRHYFSITVKESIVAQTIGVLLPVNSGCRGLTLVACLLRLT